MKRQNLKGWICALLFIGVGVAACGDEELKTYEDVARIYFKYAGNIDLNGDNDDQRTINMGYDEPLKNDTIISIPIQMMGRVVDVDREVKVELIANESTAVEGEDIEFVSATLPANSGFGNVIVRLKRTDKIATETLLARIRLVSNENFHTDYSTATIDRDNNKNGLVYGIYFTAKADMPSLWVASFSSHVLVNDIFGEYSNTKLNVILDVCKLTREDFNIDPADNDATGQVTLFKRFPDELLIGMASMVNRYLEKYRQDHGDDLKDENGNVVELASSIM